MSIWDWLVVRWNDILSFFAGVGSWIGDLIINLSADPIRAAAALIGGAALAFVTRQVKNTAYSVLTGIGAFWLIWRFTTPNPLFPNEKPIFTMISEMPDNILGVVCLLAAVLMGLSAFFSLKPSVGSVSNQSGAGKLWAIPRGLLNIVIGLLAGISCAAAIILVYSAIIGVVA